MKSRVSIHAILLLAVLSSSGTEAIGENQHWEGWRKLEFSRPEVNNKVSISYPDMLLDRFSHSNQQTHKKAGLPVKECPSDCLCDLSIHTTIYGVETVLVIKNCRTSPIHALPKLFNSHTNISQMGLINCHLSRLPSEITQLPLKTIHLEMNNFTEVPQELFKLPQLYTLVLNDNKLHSLPAVITRWQILYRLELTNNMIAELPENIGGMRDLAVLILDHNDLETLPKGIGGLSNLVHLNATHNRLKSLPDELGNLRELKGLFLSFNQLKTIPSTIRRLTNLTDLYLMGNQIKSLPSEITRLTHLMYLFISSNPLRQVPPVPMENLKAFECNNCSIRSFPCDLLTTGHIEYLGFSRNTLKSFDCQRGDLYLADLDLSHNQVQELPCDYELVNSQQISFSDNGILSLPKNCELFGFQTTRILLSQNKIKVLHFTSFCTMQTEGTLSLIDLSFNSIGIIDTSDSPLHRCFQNHAYIDLRFNKLSSIDSWPMLLSQDKGITLDVTGNKLSNFTNFNGRHFYPDQHGSNFLMRKNQIKHFMDVFNGWKIIVNTTENLNTLFKNAYFDLGFNPLACDCVDYEIYRYIQTLTTQQYNDLMCDEPLSLRKQNPQYIPLVRFVCDIVKHCPIGCDCTRVPHSQTVNVTCQNYNQTVLPEIVPDLPDENYGYRLAFSNQRLTEITTQPYLHKATEILLSNNSITGINISSSFVFERVAILHLDNNKLQRLPQSVAGMTNETAVDVRLSGNPWICDCETIAMRNWIMQNWRFVKDKDKIVCNSPGSMVGVKVKDIDGSKVCPQENNIAMYVVGAISCVVFIFIVFISLTHRIKLTKWRLVGSDECEGEHKEFDIFMCASSAEEDSEYVENFLIPELENRDFKVLYHREHFHPGKPIYDNISEALQKSKRTLVFFSNGFRDSEFSMFEFHTAHHLDIQHRTRRLITIKDTDLDMSKLDTTEVLYFQTHTFLDREDVHFWKLLEGALPKQRLGGQVRHRGLIN